MGAAQVSTLPGTPPAQVGDVADLLHSDLDAVAAEWDTLARASNAPPFARPGWILAWAEAFGDPAALAFAVARGSHGLTAVIPLASTRAVLHAPANWHTPELATVGAPAALRSALDAALGTQPRRVTLRFVPEETAAVARAALAARGYRTLERTLQVSPFVRLDALRQEGGLGESAATRGDLRRKWRRLGELGALEVDDRDGKSGLASTLAEGFRLEGSGWKEAAGTAILSQESTRRFYSRVAEWAAAEGLLSLAFLRLGGQAIAFQFGLRTEGEYYFLKGGYDPSYARYSPGRLLHARMLERMQADGVARYEFLGDTESYKQTWPHESRRLLELVGYRRSPGGIVDLWLGGYLPALLRRGRSVWQGVARPRWSR
jgi:CelD/BcsL family acetyltransferase involved in cellulose biosynthesis